MARSPVDEDQVVIEDVAALRALADPKRLSLLLATTDEPKTVKELARLLDVPPTRLYYHVKMLESHGLIRVARRRMVSGIEERSYQAVAKGWTLAAPLVSSVLARTGLIKALMDMTAAELGLALAQDDPPFGEQGSSVPVLVLTRLALDADEAVEVKRRMDSVMTDFGAGPAREGRDEYHALLAVYRRP